MASGDERRRQRQLAQDLAAGRPTSVMPQYTGSDPEQEPLHYRVNTHKDDYLVCRTWDGTNEGDTDVLIAKAYLLRRSEFEFSQNGGKTRDGKMYTYTGNTHWEREAEIVDTEETEQQRIVPAYVTEAASESVIGPDVIVPVRLATPVIVTIDGDPVSLYLMHDDGREWAKKYE